MWRRKRHKEESLGHQSNGETSEELTSSPRICPNCDNELPQGGVCLGCGWRGPGVEETQLEPLGAGTVLIDQYQIIRTLPSEYSAINRYLANDLDLEQNVLIKEGATIVASEGCVKPLHPHLPSSSSLPRLGVHTYFSPARATQLLEKDLEEEVEGYLPNPHLELERMLLDEVQYPTIVKALDHFIVEDRSYLVEEYVHGRPLREAWQSEETDQIQQINWLIELCQALTKVHAAGILYNAVDPDILIISEDNRLVLNEFSRAVRLPLPEDFETGDDCYTAPELALSPSMADIRADLYSFGATWLSLLIGRPLSDEDFEGPFVPKFPIEVHPDLHPDINRILMKTFNRDVELRFAKSGEIINERKLPTRELQKSLLHLKRSFREWKLSVGARTNTGVIRENNEDNLWVQDFSFRTAEGRANGGLFIVSDGVGGAEAGEVASRITVRTVSSTLTPILTAVMDQEENTATIVSTIERAIKAANEQICTYAQQEMRLPPGKMGCTATVVVLIRDAVYVGHVGDSRLYLVRRGKCHQKTDDHVDPQTNALRKAIGRGTSIEPDTFAFQIERGDALLLCSDGLTDYTDIEAIQQIISSSSDPQNACDQLVNLANSGGGGDNISIVLLKMGK